MENSFGEIIKAARTQKGWTAKQFIEKLKNKKPSRAYLCKIENYDEIPSPDLICRMAIALDFEKRSLLSIAMGNKLEQYYNKLNKEYCYNASLYELADK
jgi:transcriptional regulator with XRE-family HTH domain